MRETHEALYSRTIDTFLQSVAAESFSPVAVPRIAEDLRTELKQCLELKLISDAFHDAQVGRLAAHTEATMQYA